jgi:small conductance mechanosensitive channel
MMSLFAPLLAQAPPLQQACGDDPGPFCTWVFENTEIELLAAFAGRVVPATLKIVVIVAVAVIVNRLARRMVKRFVRRYADPDRRRGSGLSRRGPLASTGPYDLTRSTQRTETIAGVLRSVVTALIWIVAAFMILDTVGVNLVPLLAGAGIAGVALGFGAQSLVRDFLAGSFLLLEDQYSIGDYVDVEKAEGTVEAISLRLTRVRDIEGVVWYVPNGEISRVGNLSQHWSKTVLDIGVAYETDIDHAFQVIKRIADEVWKDRAWAKWILEEPELWGVDDFGDDSITIRLVLKTSPLKQWPVARELRKRLKEAFDAERIEIPFPQRAVWMRTADESALGDGEAASATYRDGQVTETHRQPSFANEPQTSGSDDAEEGEGGD